MQNKTLILMTSILILTGRCEAGQPRSRFACDLGLEVITRELLEVLAAGGAQNEGSPCLSELNLKTVMAKPEGGTEKQPKPKLVRKDDYQIVIPDFQYSDSSDVYQVPFEHHILDPVSKKTQVLEDQVLVAVHRDPGKIGKYGCGQIIKLPMNIFVRQDCFVDPKSGQVLAPTHTKTTKP